MTPVIGDTPEQLGSCMTADAMMINGKIVTKADYLALAAQVEVLRSTMTNAVNVTDLSANSEQASAVYRMESALAAAPADCLAQVKAEAVESAIKFCNHYMAFPVNRGNIADKVITVDELIMHAERIRQGGAA